jgi:hypothetical protein
MADGIDFAPRDDREEFSLSAPRGSVERGIGGFSVRRVTPVCHWSETVMKRSLELGSLILLGSMVVLGSTGCQTYQLGQVLPSPNHLRDDIQYFPKGPQFPLANELNAMSEAERDYREAQK